MNFIWLDINASWSHSSLALPALHANLSPATAAACNMQVVRGTIKSPVAQIVQEVAQLEPSYIFATGWLFNINYLNEVLARVSALCSPQGIFLGGPEFLGDNSDFLHTHPHITAVFKGEGEEMFEDFIASLLRGDSAWRNIPGFEYLLPRSSCGSFTYHSSSAVVVKNFKEIRCPEESPLFSWDKSFVQIETSRGCFNSCRFCVSGIEKCPIQDIPIEGLRSRLENIYNQGIRQVRVLDRTFNGNPRRALQLLDLFKEFAGKMNFHLEVHPALLFPLNESEAVKKLREKLMDMPAGLLHLEAGIQTLRQEVLDMCDRKGSCAQAVEGLKHLCGSSAFEVHADLIAGLPGYSYQHLVEDTLALMRFCPGEIQLESLKLLPGTWFRLNSDELGIRYSPLPPYEVLQTPAISYEELGKAMTLSKILDLWYNDEKWREPFCAVFAPQANDVAADLHNGDQRVSAVTGEPLLEQLIEELHGTDYITQPLSLENKGILLYRFCCKYAPSQAPLVSLQWVRNGLSTKKEPAENFVKWDFKSSLHNPLFVENDPRYKYAYLEYNGVRHWFSFNKEIERVAPCKYFAQEI